MWRYVRLYAYLLRFSFSRAMEFRIDFFFRIGMDILWNAMYIAFFTVIFLHTGMLGGWNYDQVLVFAGVLFVTDAFQMTVFSNNMWWFPIHVNRGDLDYYLVRPVSSLFFVSLKEFAGNSFVNLLIACGILTWALARYPEPIAVSMIGILALLIAMGVYINYLMNMIFLIPVFWFHNAEGVKTLFWNMASTGGRPHKIYKGWVRRTLTTILPFALVASYPVEGLFGGQPAAALLHMATVVLVGTLILAGFWKLGLRAYASASS
ncbi:MAG: ABC transporter permease [Planctomycetota bacterium]|jgi:ABC-2 type transport system permease protein